MGPVGPPSMQCADAPYRSRRRGPECVLSDSGTRQGWFGRRSLQAFIRPQISRIPRRRVQPLSASSRQLSSAESH